jgi:hypothetical protein
MKWGLIIIRAIQASMQWSLLGEAESDRSAQAAPEGFSKVISILNSVTSEHHNIVAHSIHHDDVDDMHVVVRLKKSGTGNSGTQ